MMAYKEEDRPENIEAILKYCWFDEIRNISDKE